MKNTRYIVKRLEKYLNISQGLKYTDTLEQATTFLCEDDARYKAAKAGGRVVRLELEEIELPSSKCKVGAYVEWSKGSRSGIVVQELDAGTVVIEYPHPNGIGSIKMAKADLNEPTDPVPVELRGIVQKLLDKSKGYITVETEEGFLEIQKDDNSGLFDNDISAVIKAREDGVKLIHLDDLPSNFCRPYSGYLSTKQNIQAILKHMSNCKQCQVLTFEMGDNSGKLVRLLDLMDSSQF